MAATSRGGHFHFQVVQTLGDRREDRVLAGNRQIGPAEECPCDQNDQRYGYCVENPVSYAGVEDGWVFRLPGTALV